MLDESRRDDIGWLVATYDGLVEQAEGEARNADLAQVQRWLCRVTGLASLSAAVAAARRLTRHEISFVKPVALPAPEVGSNKPGERDRDDAPKGRRKRTPRPKSNDTQRVTARRLNDKVAAELEKLLSQLDKLPRRARTAAEETQAERLRQRICELTRFSRVETARKALRVFLTRRDGVRRFVPTKPYAEGETRKPPPIRVVLGGSPGGGRRA